MGVSDAPEAHHAVDLRCGMIDYVATAGHVPRVRLLSHRHCIDSPAMSTDRVMLMSTGHVMLILTAWAEHDTSFDQVRGRPCFVDCIVMFSPGC